MFEQQRWPREAWLPISSGLLWLWCAASFGIVGFLFSLLPGCLLLASGFSTIVWRHWDRPRIEWYQGGHVSFRFHQQVRRMLDEALRECELVAS